MVNVSYWYSNCQPEDREYINQVLEFCKKYEPDEHFELASGIIMKDYYNFSSAEFSCLSMKVITKIFGETCANKLWNFMENCENIFLFDVWYTIFEEGSPDHVGLKVRMKFEVTPENLYILYVNNIWGQCDLGFFYDGVLNKILEQKNYSLFLEMFLLLDNLLMDIPKNLMCGIKKFVGVVGFLHFLPEEDRENIYNTIINTPEYHDKFSLYEIKRVVNTYTSQFVELEKMIVKIPDHYYYLCTPNFTFE